MKKTSDDLSLCNWELMQLEKMELEKEINQMVNSFAKKYNTMVIILNDSFDSFSGRQKYMEITTVMGLIT